MLKEIVIHTERPSPHPERTGGGRHPAAPAPSTDLRAVKDRTQGPWIPPRAPLHAPRPRRPQEAVITHLEAAVHPQGPSAEREEAVALDAAPAAASASVGQRLARWRRALVRWLLAEDAPEDPESL